MLKHGRESQKPRASDRTPSSLFRRSHEQSAARKLTPLALDLGDLDQKIKQSKAPYTTPDSKPPSSDPFREYVLEISGWCADEEFQEEPAGRSSTFREDPPSFRIRQPEISLFEAFPILIEIDRMVAPRKQELEGLVRRALATAGDNQEKIDLLLAMTNENARARGAQILAEEFLSTGSLNAIYGLIGCGDETISFIAQSAISRVDYQSAWGYK